MGRVQFAGLGGGCGGGDGGSSLDIWLGTTKVVRVVIADVEDCSKEAMFF